MNKSVYCLHFINWLLLTWFLVGTCPTLAQTQADPVLVGVTSDGGDGFGTIYQFTPPASGTVTPAILTLTGVAGENPTTNMLTVYNNKIYGMTRQGGGNNVGIIFVYDPTSDVYTKLYDFNGPNGTLPAGSMTVYNDKLYGTTSSGGQSSGGSGVIFSFDPATNIYTKLKSFSGISGDGGSPVGALTVYNNKLYGMTSNGGTGNGIIYEYDPATNTYTKKKDFVTADGTTPLGSLTVFGTKLFGLTPSGGTFTGGVLFEFDPATNAYTKRKEFDSNTADGFAPRASLVVYNNKLYGTTANGGSVSNYGTLFEYDPTTTVFTKKFDFPGSAPGFTPNDLTVLGNELYGTLASSAIYSYNPATNSITTRKTFVFNNRMVEGYTTSGGLTAFNNRLYGMTYEGGSENEGVLYELNPSGNIYTKKRDFSGSNGRTPLSGMTYYNGKLYGTTRTGGVNGAGVIYEYDPVTRQYIKKKEFSDTDGRYPWGSLLIYNCKLYGLTSEGGTGGGGVLFEYDPIANTYIKKRDFGTYNNTSGGQPYGSLAVFNNKLYGLTYYGGTNGVGVIFEYDLSNNTYTKKRDLSNVDGRGFYGRLSLFNNKFYGLMNSNGSGSGNAGTGLGTLFEYDPTTSTFTKKLDFYNGPEGYSPNGSLTLFNNKFYGLMSGGLGTLFEFEPVTNTITVRKAFSGSGGGSYSPVGSLVVFRGKLYGQTKSGGLNNLGEVFSFDPIISGSSSYSAVFATTTGQYTTPNGQPSPQLVVFPDCQLSAIATIASSSICVNDVVGLSVAVQGQNCQPSYSWTSDPFSRLTSPATTSALSATALLAGVRSFSVTVTESLCSVQATTNTSAFDIFSVQNGNWDNPTTWSCGRVPFAADIVNIRHQVTLPPNYTANALQLKFDSNKQLIYNTQAKLQLAFP